MFKFRPYQEENLTQWLSAKKNTIVCQPTGTGKSVVMRGYILKRLEKGVKKLAVLVPNRVLVKNISRYFESNSVTEAYSGVIPNLEKSILISTYQSASKYLKKFNPEVIIIDEAHHFCSNTLVKIFSEFPDVEFHGLTATPNRLDGKGLYKYFQNLIMSPSISWFIDQGYLADYKLRVIESPLFTNHSGLDNLSDQEKLFGSKPEIKKTVDLWFNEAYDTKSLFFVTSQQHGEELKKEFENRGIQAEFLTHKTPNKKREDSLKLFEQSRLKILINIQLFTEGVDIPSLESLFICRFTFSEALALQMLGRVTRPYNGIIKNIFDLTGITLCHGSLKLPREWSLLGQSFRGSSNRESIYAKCFYCDQELVHKKYLWFPTEVCCLNCGQENILMPPERRSSKEKESFLGNNFELSEMASMNPEIYTALTTLLVKKSAKIENKISKVLSFDVPSGIKKKCLLYLGVDKQTINFYLEDIENEY